MKMRLNMGIATAGVAVILLSGCVSSKKYKSSQAALQEMRNDSVQLAQQVASLNQNVQSLQDKNSALQRSLDSSSNSYAAQQKNLGYYQDYFTQQQTSASQMSDELKSSLSQAGVSNDDIQQVNNTIYVRLDENAVFKKNSTSVTTSGKQALDGLADAIKKRSDVNVFINDGDSSSGSGNMSSSSGMGNSTASESSSGEASSGAMSSSSAPRHHRVHHRMSSAKSTASSGTSATSATTKPHVAHRKAHRKYSSEGSSMTYVSNMGKSSNAWMLKQRRMGVVANSFLQSGIPKVNITMRQPDMNNAKSNNIKVVIVPKMTDFNPPTASNAESK